MLCAACSEPLPPKRGRGKPRKFCTTCRPPRDPANRTEPTPPRLAAMPPASLESAVAEELRQAGRLDSSLGQQAVSLAERIASEQDSGSAIASMHRELRLIMGAATAGMERGAGDVLDDLAARRERRGA